MTGLLFVKDIKNRHIIDLTNGMLKMLNRMRYVDFFPNYNKTIAQGCFDPTGFFLSFFCFLIIISTGDDLVMSVIIRRR